MRNKETKWTWLLHLYHIELHFLLLVDSSYCVFKVCCIELDQTVYFLLVRPGAITFIPQLPSTLKKTLYNITWITEHLKFHKTLLMKFMGSDQKPHKVIGPCGKFVSQSKKYIFTSTTDSLLYICMWLVCSYI